LAHNDQTAHAQVSTACEVIAASVLALRQADVPSFNAFVDCLLTLAPPTSHLFSAGPYIDSLVNDTLLNPASTCPACSQAGLQCCGSILEAQHALSAVTNEMTMACETAASRLLPKLLQAVDGHIAVDVRGQQTSGCIDEQVKLRVLAGAFDSVSIHLGTSCSAQRGTGVMVEHTLAGVMPAFEHNMIMHGAHCVHTCST
jgi:hypothetical protein